MAKLNANQINAALKKLKDLQGEELTTAIKDNYPEDEATQILDSIGVKGDAGDIPGTTQPPIDETPIVESAKVADPSEEIIKQLKAIDTKEGLKGADCKKYYELLNQLDGNVHLTFEVKKVDVIRDQRYEGVENSPVDLVGVIIKETKNIHTTKIPVKHALQFIGRLEFPMRKDPSYFNIVGSQINPGHPAVGRFYFVK
jgi:hypothetical protein